MLRYPIDPSRVYVAGMSAGGAMTAILALTHGALFAACAVASGVMYGAADSAAGAVRTMHEGSRRSPVALAEEAAAVPSRALGFVPALIIHGVADPVVHPRNADQISAQFSRFAEPGERAAAASSQNKPPTAPWAFGDRVWHQRDYERDGQLVLRELLIEGLAHAWSGGDSRSMRSTTPRRPMRAGWSGSLVPVSPAGRRSVAGHALLALVAVSARRAPFAARRWPTRRSPLAIRRRRSPFAARPRRVPRAAPCAIDARSALDSCM